MTVKERKRVNRLKHLLILLGFVELGLLIACIRATKTDEFDVPTGKGAGQPQPTRAGRQGRRGKELGDDGPRRRSQRNHPLKP